MASLPGRGHEDWFPVMTAKDEGAADTRRYESPLREDQARATRERILDALIAVITSDGVAELSVPAVAREAGVSVPTVYRHFGSKQALVEALAPYVAGKAGLMWPGRPVSDRAEVRDVIVELYRRSDSMDPALRAVMATDTGQEARKSLIPRRRAAIEEILAPVLEGLGEEQRSRVRDSFLLLTSSAAMRVFKDYLGMDTEEAAAAATWAFEAIVDGLSVKVEGT